MACYGILKPNGKIEQCETVSGTFNHETQYTFTLPITFSNADYIATATIKSSSNLSSNRTVHVFNSSASKIGIMVHTAGSATYTGNINYIANGC